MARLRTLHKRKPRKPFYKSLRKRGYTGKIYLKFENKILFLGWCKPPIIRSQVTGQIINL